MKDVISNLSLETFQARITKPRVEGFAVTNVNKAAYYLKPGVAHKADFYCVILVGQGSQEFAINGIAGTLSKGDILLASATGVFTVFDVSADYDATYLFFSKSFLQQAGFNYKSNEIVQNLSTQPAHIISNEAGLFGQLSGNMKRLQELNSGAAADHYGNELIWHHFSILMYELAGFLKQKQPHQSHTLREEEITTKFFSLLQQHYKEQHEVGFYAGALCITRKHLSK